MIKKPLETHIRKNFKVFSCALFLVFSLTAFTAYVFAVRQINLDHIEQQLTITSEAIKLHLSKEVSSELALVLKLGSSPAVKAYFLNPEDPLIAKNAYEEFDLFQEHIRDKVVFWVNDIDKIFYAPGFEPYSVDPQNPEYYWYNLTLYQTETYNFNINYNSDMNVINLWVNVPVFDEFNNPIGMLGTGIDLTEFTDFVNSTGKEYDENITSYLFNGLWEITSIDDFELISNKVLVTDYLGAAGEEAVRVAETLTDEESRSYIFGDNMYMVRSLPTLSWYSLSFYPLPGYLALNQSMNIVFFGMLSMILVLFIIINIFVAHSEHEMREQNARLREANRKAESGSRAKSNFLATMSHEIRTPMNAIIGIAQIELQKGRLPDEYAKALISIYNSGNGLLGIINDVLDMSKIETGKLELNLSEYNLPCLINDAAQINIVRLGSKKIEFILDIDENLPLRLYGDELRLKQILNNLLSNAIKYTDKGSVKLSVSYFSSANDRDIILRFTVEDTGQGMKPEDRAKLFSEYSRFNISANQYIEGTGIGLSITKNLVGMMNGTIEAESEYGKGSRFIVTVRQKVVGDEKIGTEISERLKSFKFAGNKQLAEINILREFMPYGRVLVVDDVNTNLYVAEGMLLPYGLKIETAYSGFEVIDKIENGEMYDIIFMDHMMPLMDGIETTQKLRSLGYKGVIVALTANALVGSYEMFRQNGFDGFVPKPIDAWNLNEVLNRFVRDRHPEEAEKYTSKPVMPQAIIKTVQMSPKMLEVFRHDAEDAVATLRKTVKNGDIKLFTITVHAMKSALASIGEAEKSKTASKLEDAGHSGDIEFISANANDFIKSLETLAQTLVTGYSENGENSGNDKSDEVLTEDTAYLYEQLLIIKNACEEYDDAAAYDALDRLRDKKNPWKKQTSAMFEEVRDMLFLHSDFEGAAEKVSEKLEQLAR
ncbi:MAG: ATP-binding protein [Oscillospiraceae bacterium]|nr:ATP-binding protein [Oscillospiraceae bacterium]